MPETLAKLQFVQGIAHLTLSRPEQHNAINSQMRHVFVRLIDELHLHLAHQLLGGGDRLFEDVGALPLQKVKVVDSAAVTHIKFRMLKESSL